jgi:hypothetical protein
MSNQWRSFTTLALIVAIAGAVLVGAQQQATTSDTYTWNGELVSLDAAAKTITVKARVAYQDAVSEMKHFKAGDRVWIAWSGVHDYSDAVRQIRRPETGRTIDENLVLPAELVSTEPTNQYITFRVNVPDTELSAIKTVKPGEWVTVTSRHRPSTDHDAVTRVRPYGTTTIE